MGELYSQIVTGLIFTLSRRLVLNLFQLSCWPDENQQKWKVKIIALPTPKFYIFI